MASLYFEDAEQLLEVFRAPGVLLLLFACGLGIVVKRLVKSPREKECQPVSSKATSNSRKTIPGSDPLDDADLCWSRGYGRYKYLALHDDPWSMSKPADYSLEPLSLELPQLTSMQTDCLSALSARVADLESTRRIRVDPSTLIRYLRARNWNVEQTEQFLRQTAEYREKHDMNRMFSHWNLEAYEKCLAPWWLSGGFIGHTKNQEPIAIERIGRCNFAKLVSLLSFEDLLKLDQVNAQRMLAALEEDAMRRGRPLSQVLVVMDLQGFGKDQVSWKAAKALAALVESRTVTLTEVTKKVLAVNAPPAAAHAWALMKHLLDAGTAAKVEVVTAKDTYETLSKYIDDEVIPAYLGGSKYVNGDPECREILAPGGLPPRAALERFSELVRNGQRIKSKQNKPQVESSKLLSCCVCR